MRYDPSDHTPRQSAPAFEAEAQPKRKRPVLSFMKAATAAGLYFYMTSIPGNADLDPGKRGVTLADRLIPEVVLPDPKAVPKIPVRTTRVSPDYDVLPKIVDTVPVARVPLVFQPVDATKACSPKLVHADKFAAVAVIVRADGKEEVVLEVGADLPRHPASMTKMMTLLIAFQQIEAKKLSLRDVVAFSMHARSAPKTNIASERGALNVALTVEQVMLAVGVRSANDAARALAEKIAGSEVAFAKLMNENAAMIGMNASVFKNASGLPDSQQVTTARDMLKLETYLQAKYPSYMKYLSTTSFTLKSIRKGKKKPLNLQVISGNQLLKEELDGGWIVDSAKTGSILSSGFNMAMLAHRTLKGKKREQLRMVVMGGKTRGQRDECIETIAARL